jgi:hypothetical protein
MRNPYGSLACLRLGNTGQLPLSDEPQFHLGHHAEDGKHHFPIGPSVLMAGSRTRRCAPKVQHAATKPVQLDQNKAVTGLDEVHHSR